MGYELANAGVSADPLSSTVLSLAVISILAILGKELMQRLHQAAVLGLLIAGVILGNLNMLRMHDLDFVRDNSFVDMFAQVGIIFLMFETGLESSVGKMREVGIRAIVVACAGATVSILLGALAARQLFPLAHAYATWFSGVMIAATSVGVGAAVLGELRVIKSETAALILGAAVIDDVLALIGLAVIDGMTKGVATGQVLSYGAIGCTVPFGNVGSSCLSSGGAGVIPVITGVEILAILPSDVP
jgi:Kef-type K+ transport system membrane component KefB